MSSGKEGAEKLLNRKDGSGYQLKHEHRLAFAKLLEISDAEFDRLLQPKSSLPPTFAQYLRRVADEGATLSSWTLGGKHEKGLGEKNFILPLLPVYAALETDSRPASPPGKSPEKNALSMSAPPLTAWEVLFDPRHRSVVLTGDPGSGKSTCCQYVALFMADHGLIQMGAQDYTSRFAGVKVPALPAGESWRVPVCIDLGKFAKSLPWPVKDERGQERPGQAKDLLIFLESRWKADYQLDAGHFHALFASPQALVLFDGLDEVRTERLEFVKQAMEAFAACYAQCRFVVTCRQAVYPKPDPEKTGAAETKIFPFVLSAKNFPVVHRIAPLSSALQDEFIVAWYQTWEAALADDLANAHLPRLARSGDELAARLREAVQQENLQNMAANPFFLTALATMNGKEMELPRTPAALMEKMVDCILDESRKEHAPDAPPVLQQHLSEPNADHQLVEARKKAFRSALQYVAHETRRQRPNALPGETPSSPPLFINQDTLERRLMIDEDLFTPKRAKQLIADLLQRAGLLQSDDAQNLTFAYRFEEYLAGCHLADDAAWGKSAPSRKSFAERAFAHLEGASQNALEVVKWAAGWHAHVNRQIGPVCDLIDQLRHSHRNGEGASFSHLAMAAEIAREAGLKNETGHRAVDTYAALTQDLTAVRRDDGQLYEIKNRASAASALGWLGCLERGTGLKPDGLPDIEWIKVPQGEFWMGGEEAWEGGRKDQITIPSDYHISRYLVTVGQFEAFVQDGGYQDQRPYAQGGYWTAAGRRWRDDWQDDETIAPAPADYPKGYKESYERWRQEQIALRKRNQGFRGPWRFGGVFDTPNHPIVGVNWFEANAFCRWLGEKRFGKPDAVRLPSEPEWERAARGDDLTQGRRYPWGEEETEAEISARCNWEKTGLKATSAVGLFPLGDVQIQKNVKSSLVSDLAGNVWEWTRSQWGEEWEKAKHDYPYDAEDGREDAEAAGNMQRVLRGGSWCYDLPAILRCSFRYGHAPGGRINDVGFRCVLVVGVSAPG